MNDPAITRYPHPTCEEALAVPNEVKKVKIAEKVREILQILGLNLADPSLVKTPERIAKMYVDDIFSGLQTSNFPEMTTYDEKIPPGPVIVRNVLVSTFCEHHFVPVAGVAHIAYIPNGKILGLSKIHRIVRYFSRRPQLQERLTAQIADSLSIILGTEDVAVVIQAKHFCIFARGIEDQMSDVETSILKGKFDTDADVRRDFFSRIPTRVSFT